MGKNIRAVIFDIDDTLFDRNAAQVTVIRLIIQRFPQLFGGLEAEQVLSAFLESDRQSTVDWEAGKPGDFFSRDTRTRYFLNILGIRQDYAGAIAELYVSEYPKLNVPIDGAVPLVRQLSARFPLGVISNSLADVQYVKLESIGLRDLFSCIVLSEEIGIRKPDARIFHRAAEILRVLPSDCLFVGDSYGNDVVGAKAAGMQACWYNPLSRDPPRDDIKTDFVINKMADLERILEIS